MLNYILFNKTLQKLSFLLICYNLFVAGFKKLVYCAINYLIK